MIGHLMIEFPSPETFILPVQEPDYQTVGRTPGDPPTDRPARQTRRRTKYGNCYQLPFSARIRWFTTQQDQRRRVVIVRRLRAFVFAVLDCIAERTKMQTSVTVRSIGPRSVCEMKAMLSVLLYCFETNFNLDVICYYLDLPTLLIVNIYIG